MNARDTKSFLVGLRQALESFGEKGAEEERIADHCAMASLAVPHRLQAADERTSRFATRRSKPQQTKERKAEENQVVFDFLANACAAVESLCFSAYFFGAIVNRAAFSLHEKPLQIRPHDTLDGYQAIAPGDRFTEGLAALLNAQEYREMTVLNQYFSRRLPPRHHPSGAEEPSSQPGEVPLEDWDLGPDWLAEKRLGLGPDALAGYLEWLEGRLGNLGDDLDAFAQSQGF